MKILDFLDNVYDISNVKKYRVGAKEQEIIMRLNTLWCYKLALFTASERIGSILSKCEIKTYVKNNPVEESNWYLFNVEPNPNQTSCEFMKQLARQLVFHQEALVVVIDGNLYIASSFEKDEYQIRETYFKNVCINIYGESELALEGIFSGENAIYIKAFDQELSMVLMQMAQEYAGLIENIKKIGNNKLKFALHIDETAMAGDDFDEYLNEIVNEDFAKLVSDNHAILPLPNGFKLEAINSGLNGENGRFVNSSVNTELDEIFKQVGQALNIPLSVMNGTYQNDDKDDFLTFCIDPLCDMISEAFNRKFYGKKYVLEGTYLDFDTKKIKHFDILTVSDSINKLISSGVYTINEIRAFLDEQPIDEEIGNIHWITRNYAVIGDYIDDPQNSATYTEEKREAEKKKGVKDE